MTIVYTSQESFDDLARHSENAPILILKYSNTCGTSERALARATEYSEENPDTDVFVVTVQERRDLSDEIEMRLGIQHESPQAIVLFKGSPLYYDDHASINFDKISQVVREADMLL